MREATMEDRNDQTGYGVIVLRGPDGRVKERREFRNLITTAGDEYAAKMIITGVAPASASAPTKVTGMKLGTGTTAAAKSGAGAALVTYLSGSNQAFDTSFPQTAAVSGTDTGYVAIYECTWAAGDATNSAITEAVIVTDSSTDATSSAANTIARTVFAAIDKEAGDSLTLTWNHKQLGA